MYDDVLRDDDTPLRERAALAVLLMECPVRYMDAFSLLMAPFMNGLMETTRDQCRRALALVSKIIREKSLSLHMDKTSECGSGERAFDQTS